MQLLAPFLHHPGILQVDNEKQIPKEVVVMEKAADGGVETTATVSLLDLYDMEKPLMLLMEGPTPAEFLSDDRTKKLRMDEAKETKVGWFIVL